MASTEYLISVRMAQIVGIAASTFLSGTLTSISMMTIPILLQTPTPTSLLLQQWKTLFISGRARGPVIAAVAGLAFAYVAYDSYTRDAEWMGYASAGAAAIGIVPYTLLLMMEVNGKLMGAATGKVEVNDEDVRGLVRTWGRLNAGRGILPMIGGVVGLWAALR